MLAGLEWQETNHLSLKRGPYRIAAGLDESIAAPAEILKGRFVSLFDPELKLVNSVTLSPGSREFLLDLDFVEVPKSPTVLASACKALPLKDKEGAAWTVEGVGDTNAVILISSHLKPKSITLNGEEIQDTTFEAGLLHVRFANEARPRVLKLEF